jgi:hypothetical protein
MHDNLPTKTDLPTLSAGEMTRHIAAGNLSSVELVETHIRGQSDFPRTPVEPFGHPI